MTKKPVLIELDPQETEAVDVAAAPPVPDDVPETSAATPFVPRSSRIGRWFWSLLVLVAAAFASITAWEFLLQMLSRWPVFGLLLSVASAAVLLLGFVLVLTELTALSRLRRVERLRSAVKGAGEDFSAAKAASDKIIAFYSRREDLDWARANLNDKLPDIMDGDAILTVTEDLLLVPLDQQALREVERAARQVATVTAVVPLALADLVAVLLSSVRMIRSVAQIYGGRSGFWSSWRLTRSVLTHLAATGAVAIGDDLIEPLLGGSIVSKLSRRFGEGLVNGALTARVGLAAMEVCRPMPFSKQRKPAVRTVIRNALTGVFTKADA